MNNLARNRVVIKLSGSVFNMNDNQTQAEVLKRYSSMLVQVNQTIQPVVIAGGGSIARYYIQIARNLGLDESSLDLIGIDVSRLNAKLLISSLGEYAYPNVPKSLDEISNFVVSNKIIVSGGLHPGQSTNATAALIAEKIRAKEFINATDVNGIYDMDPRKNKSAKLYEKITLKECVDMLLNGSSMAGEYDLMDIVALKVIERSAINTRVILSSPENIINTLEGKEYKGTELILK
ncbi:MAG: UMP kinase [Nitrososphaeraceae archaeon]|nr:UMP kinase [Nitrososphaeraceae archaeon]